MFLHLAAFHATQQILPWMGDSVRADIWSAFSQLLLGAVLDPHLITCAAAVKLPSLGSKKQTVFIHLSDQTKFQESKV